METSLSMLECIAKKSLRDQIIAIYNNDGPGFSKDVVASAAYQNLLPLITTIVPRNPLWLDGYLNIRKIMLLLRVKIRD